MTHRDSTGPVIGLKLVTLLFTLSPELLFLGAGLKLKENGYDGLLVAINPRVPEDLKLITNIKVSGNYAINSR
jgi:calcium-activated chloride channel regulator 2